MGLDWATMPIPAPNAPNATSATSATSAVPSAQAELPAWATMPVGGASFVQTATPQQLQALTPAQRDFLASQIKSQWDTPVLPPQPQGFWEGIKNLGIGAMHGAEAFGNAFKSAQGVENLGIGALQGFADLGNALREGARTISEFPFTPPSLSMPLRGFTKFTDWASGMSPEAEAQHYSDIYGNIPAAKVGRFLGFSAITAPVAAGVGKFAGMLLPDAASIPGVLARLSAQSAAEGGTYGGLAQPEPGGSRALNAVTGAVTGSLIPPVLAGVGKIGKVGLSGFRAMTPGGRRILAENTVGEKLAGLMNLGNGTPVPVEPAFQGMAQSLGQSTGNPAILALEKGAFDTPVGAAAYNEMRNKNSAIILKHAEQLASRIHPENLDDTSVALADEITKARDAARPIQADLWNKIAPPGTTFIEKQPLDSDVQNAIKSLGPVRARFVPPEISSMMESLPDRIPIETYKDLRSVVSGIAGKYRIAGDSNAAEATGRILGALNKHLDGIDSPDLLRLPPGSTDPADAVPMAPADAREVMDRFNAARQFSKRYHAIFDAHPMQRLFALDQSGAERVAPERVAQNLLMPSAPQGITQAQQAFALGGRTETGPDVLQSALVSRWLSAARTPELDADGNAILSGTRLRNFHTANSALFNRAFPGESSKALLGKIMKAVDQNDAIRNYVGTGGSPTALKIQGQSLVNDLMGHVYSVSPFQTGIEGALAGDVLKGPNAIPAWYMGGRLAGYGRQQYLRALRPVREEILTDALANPKIGLKLIGAANERNAQGLYPWLRKFLVPANATTTSTLHQ